MKHSVISVFLSYVLISCATPSQVAQESEQRFDSMTLESVKECISTKSDEMSEIVTFSSYNCYQYESGILRMVWTDYFIRGYKDKKSGVTSYQVYAILYGNDWSYPYSASYLMPQKNGDTKLIRVDTKRITTDVSCSSGSCTHEEHYTFPLKSSYLKALSDNYDEISSIENAQKMRIFRKAVGDVDFVFNINELVGIYRKVESY